MGVPCKIPNCNCTHDGGCDRGWISMDDEFGNDLGKTAPCPNCRPGLKRALEMSWGWEDRAENIARVSQMERADFLGQQRALRKTPVAVHSQPTLGE